MEKTCRLFNCEKCHKQVLICSHCDRGNIYCSKECSRQARTESSQTAGKRYQNTHQGRMNHAHRQSIYRARQNKEIEKVTHQGSNEITIHVPLEVKELPEDNRSTNEKHVFCDFCGCACSDFIRLDTGLSGNHHHSDHAIRWPCGP